MIMIIYTQKNQTTEIEILGLIKIYIQKKKKLIT